MYVHVKLTNRNPIKGGNMVDPATYTNNDKG